MEIAEGSEYSIRAGAAEEAVREASLLSLVESDIRNVVNCYQPAVCFLTLLNEAELV